MKGVFDAAALGVLALCLAACGAGSRPLYYFTDSLAGEKILVATDGTVAGTRSLGILPKGVPQQFGGDLIQHLVSPDGPLFFWVVPAGVPLTRELWFSDGARPARLVKEIRYEEPACPLAQPGRTCGSYAPFFLDADGQASQAQAGSRAYFFNFTLDSGYQVWTSDGTSEGTHLAADLGFITTDAGSGADGFVSRSGRFFFVNRYPTASDRSLYVCDGALRTARVVAPLALSTVLLGLFDDVPLLTDGRRLWTDDGHSEATLAHVASLPGLAGPMTRIAGVVIVPDAVYFATYSGSRAADFGYAPQYDVGYLGFTNFNTGFVLWKASVNGVTALHSFENDNLQYAAGGRRSLFLRTAAEVGSSRRYRVWTTDGTAAGTQPFELPGLDGVLSGRAPGDLLFFVTLADGRFWRSDGSAHGTFPVGQVGSTTYIRAVGDRYVYEASDPREGKSYAEIWSTDGTAAGTVRLHSRCRFRCD